MKITIAAAFVLSSSILQRIWDSSRTTRFKNRARLLSSNICRRIRRMQRSSGTIGLTVN